MFCGQCGAEVRIGAAFCPKCGAKQDVTLQREVLQQAEAAKPAAAQDAGVSGGLPSGNAPSKKKGISIAGIVAIAAIGLAAVAAVVIIVVLLATGGHLKHEWEEVTCTSPKTCSVCGETEGEALGHIWVEATCTVPNTCSICGETEGKALGHIWTEATCTVPKNCSVCSETEGEALGHDWMDATCTTPKNCKRCKDKEGEALGHDLNAVDVCNRCDEYMGEGIAFTFEDGVLTVFGKGELTKETWRAALEKYGDDSDEKYPYFDACNTMIITGNIKGISRDVFDKDTYFRYYTRTDFLEKLVIEDSVTGEIGWSAFGDRYNLDDVYIGNGIHTISIGAFDGDWMRMTSFSVSGNCTLEVSYQKDGYGSLTGVMNDIFGSGSISVIADRCKNMVTYRR